MIIKQELLNVRVKESFLSKIYELPGSGISEKIGGAIVLSMCQIEAAKGNLWAALYDFQRAENDQMRDSSAALFLCLSLKNGCDIHQNVNEYVNKRTFGRQKISFRFYPKIKEKIMRYSGRNFEDRVRKLLFIATIKPVDMTEKPKTSDFQLYYKVLPRLGNKWHGGFQNCLDEICKRLEKIDIYVDAFCGTLGCTALREKAQLTIVNDAEKDTVNLIRVIQEHPLELALELAAIPPNKATFEEIKEQSKCKRMGDVTAAAEFVFRLEMSHYAKGDNFDTKKTNLNIIKYACRILRLSPKIKGFKVHLGSAIPFLNDTLKVHDGEKILVFLDHPYLNVPEYDVNETNEKIGEFTKNDHRTLVDLMKKKHSNEINFVYFCRVNDPKTREEIDEFFKETGFYFVDIVFWNATERIVTTVDMTGTDGFQRY